MLLLAVLFVGINPLKAQTNSVTATASGIVFYAATGGVVIWGFENTNSTPITLRKIGTYLDPIPGLSATYTLWYHPTLTGAPTAISTTNGWIQIGASQTVPFPSTPAGIYTLLSGLDFKIPANTTYRFCLQASAQGPYYATASSSANLMDYPADGVKIHHQASTISPGYSGTMTAPATNTPRGFFGTMEFDMPIPNNAAITSLVSPVNFCGGNQDIKVRVKNHGNNIINTVTINWKLDGVLQTPILWNAPLDTLGGTLYVNDTAITLANINFAGTTPKTVEAWTSMPNGIADTATKDDTLRATLRPALSGVYTIGGTSPSFNTISDAANALNLAGICGPVTFNVAPGLYTGSVIIGTINGSSSTNTITFNGNGAKIESTVSPVVAFTGSSYVSFNNFHIEGVGATAGTAYAGFGVYITGAAHHITLDRNIVDVGMDATVTTNGGIIVSGSPTAPTTAGNNAQYLTITNNEVIGGYYSFTLMGVAGYLNNYGHYIANNTFRDFYAYGPYFANADTLTFVNNNIHRANRPIVTTLYGIYMTTSRNMKIQRNRLHDFGVASYTAYPMYIANCVNAAGYETEVSNNAIYNIGTISTMYGIYSLTTAITGFNFYHNTIHYDIPVANTGTIRGLFLSVAITNVNFKNNIINLTGAGTGVKTGIYITTTSTSFFSNNNVINVNTTTSNNVGYWTAARATLANWQTASSQDALSLAVDPQFMDAANGNLKPMASALDNKGTAVGVTKDIEGYWKSLTTPDLGAYESFSSSPDHASVEALAGPFNFCGGSQPVKVRIRNKGNNVMNNVTVNWTLDGVAQTPVNWTAPLDTLGGALYPNDTAITLGNTTFGTTPKILKAWTTSPNGVADTIRFDDTLQTSIIPALNGVYTIGGTTPNYATIDDAVKVLNKAGVCGPVTFNVAPGSGPYTSQLSFAAVPGTSTANTVTFNGNGATITSFNSPILSFSGSSYIAIDSFKIVGAGTAYAGVGVYVSDQSHHLTFDHNMIDVGMTSTATTNAGIAISSSPASPVAAGNNARYLTITHNEIIGGYYSLTMMGNAGYLDNYGHHIANNTFREFYSYGPYFGNADTVTFMNNDITRPARLTVTTLYGIYTVTSRNLKIQKNKLHDFGVAAYTAYPMYFTNSVNAAGYETEVSNNLIYNIGTSSTMYGIYCLTTATTGFNFYHNTIQYDVPGANTAAVRGVFFAVAPTNVNFKNNIISITGSGTGVKTGIYMGATTSTTFSSDNNVIYVNTGTSDNVGYYTSARVTLANWQTAATQDALSVSVNPVFSSLLSGNMTPVSSGCDNIGANVGITTDITGAVRSVTTPDVGGIEFTGVAGDFAIEKAELLRSSACYSNQDTVKITVRNVVGTTVDFSVNPLKIHYKVTGPMNTTDSILISSGTLALADDTVFYATNINMTKTGVYTVNAHLVPNAVNASTTNDTLAIAGTITVKSILEVSPKNVTVHTSADTAILTAKSTLFPGGSLYISEICHWRGATGAAPVPGGWPTYLIADDYLEISGVPNSDFAGYTLEEWTGTALQHTVTFPVGTLFSPTGTLILATGQLGASVASPANFYYHTGNTITHGSTDVRAYLIKDGGGTIVDAVTYGAYVFPAASGVTPADWSGTTPSVSSAGIKIIAPDNNTGSVWAVEDASGRQTPNAINPGTPTPSAGVLTGFNWNYLGSSIATTPRVVVGPYTIPGVYVYVASFTNPCGTFYDTVYVEAASTVPVELLRFSAAKAGADVNLAWQTASEINNNRFEIERSTDGVDFKEIGKVEGMGTTEQMSYYKHTDKGAANMSARTLYYRLKQVDNDGAFTYSKTVTVALSDKRITHIGTRPNPSDGRFTISADMVSTTPLNIKVINVIGATVWTKTVTPVMGSNSFDANLGVPAGVYMLLLEQDGEMNTVKFVIEK